MRDSWTISTVPAPLVFLGAGVFAIVFAFITFGLLMETMANLHLVQTHGWMAVIDGGLLQFLWLSARAALSLAAYIGFKICEVELVARWRL